VIRGQKGEHRDLFEEYLKQGFVRARVDGQVISLSSDPQLDRQMRHDIEIVIDRVTIQPEIRARLAEAIEMALKIGAGNLIATLGDPVEPPDRSDGQFAHLDGLNLYRGHALRALAARLPAGHPRVPELLSAAEAGISAGLGRACGGDYMGEHWLATYAVLALADPS